MCRENPALGCLHLACLPQLLMANVPQQLGEGLAHIHLEEPPTAGIYRGAIGSAYERLNFFSV